MHNNYVSLLAVRGECVGGGEVAVFVCVRAQHTLGSLQE